LCTSAPRLGARRSNRQHLEQRPRSPADACYLEELAQRLAADACLPLALARRRVQALAISAAPPRRRFRRPEPVGQPAGWPAKQRKRSGAKERKRSGAKEGSGLLTATAANRSSLHLLGVHWRWAARNVPDRDRDPINCDQACDRGGDREHCQLLHGRPV
jgi:hypothetical protein